MFEAIVDLINHPENYDNLKESQIQAFDAINDYLKDNSRDKEAFELKIQLSVLLQKYNVAKQSAKTLLMLGGEESEYLDYVGKTLLLSGDFDGAENSYMRAYKLDPDSSFHFGTKYKQTKELNKLKKEGNDNVSKRNYDEAIKIYTTGVERCKELNLSCSYMFLNNRAACYMNIKRYDLALEDVNQSLAQNPHIAKCYIRRITCIKMLKNEALYSEIPVNYLNALYSMGYQDSSARSLCREYVQFLRDNRAFKSNVQSVSSKKDLDRVLGINPGVLIVLDIYASWCGPCKKLAPILDELSVSHPSVIFLKIDGDRERSVSSHYNVEGFPSIFFIRNNSVITKVVGYDPDMIENTINSNVRIPQDSLFA